MANTTQRISNEKRAEVISEILEEPKITVREVEARTGVSRSSVDRIKKEELGHLRREKEIMDIIASDIAILKAGQQQVFEKITEGKASLGDVVRANQDSTRRYQLLTGGATSRVEIEQPQYVDKEIEAIVIEAEAKIRDKFEKPVEE